MVATFAIRRALQSDAGALSVFAARLFRDTYCDDTAAADLDAYIDKSFRKECQEREIADHSAAIFLATGGGLIVGYAHVVIASTEISPAFLNRIYVDAEWRGVGVANGLLDAVAAEARRRGAANLELTVYERNLRAIAFYKRMGFAQTGNTTFMVGEDLQTDLVMTLDLAGLQPRASSPSA